MIFLRPEDSVSRLLGTLHSTLNELQNVEGTSGDAPEALRKYLSWVNNSVRMLGSTLKASELDRLITTKRYWALQSLVAIDPGTLREIINLEVAERKEALSFEIRTLQRELSRWGEVQGVIAVVLDTNVLLDHHQELTTRDWRIDLGLDNSKRLVFAIPMAVVDELDRLKRDRRNPPKGELAVRTRARQALRNLEGLFKEPDKWVELSPRIAGRGATHLTLISDRLEHAPLSHGDSEIVDRALTLKPFAEVVILVAYDTGIVFRARIAGLATHLMKDLSPDNDQPHLENS